MGYLHNKFLISPQKHHYVVVLVQVLLMSIHNICFLWRNKKCIVLGFNDMSTLVDHFVSSPREREKRDRKRDRRDSRGDEREEQGRKRNRNESEETEEIKHSPSSLTCYKGSRPCPTVS